MGHRGKYPIRGGRQLHRGSFHYHLRHRSGRQDRRHPDRPVHTRCPRERFSAHRNRPRVKSGRLFVWFQHALPQHALSRLVLRATRARAPWFKNSLIKGFLRLYAIDMSEAVQPDPFRYGSFNEFFTRALKPDVRTLAMGPREIACPVDGTISEAGKIDGVSLLQAKGRHYTLDELLASRGWAKHFEGGAFATIYLAPFNYHRIHMPLHARLRETVYVPGRLFSVNAATASLVPRLFARNERVLTLFDSAFGEFALILVGALNVGSIATVWAGDITP